MELNDPEVLATYQVEIVEWDLERQGLFADNRGRGFIPDTLVVTWRPWGSVWRLVAASIGGIGVRQDGVQMRSSRYMRWTREDSWPAWLGRIIAAGPTGAEDAARQTFGQLEPVGTIFPETVS